MELPAVPALNLKAIMAIVAATVIGIASLYVLHLRSALKDANHQIEFLTGQLHLQNDAIATAHQAFEDAQARQAVAVQEAASAAKPHQERAQAIEQAKPSVPQDACKSADDLMNEELPE